MRTQVDDQTYALILRVRNRPGVLVRCAQIFGRRGHNIEALRVAAEPRHADISIMHITAIGRPEITQQIIAQLGKLVDVFEVKVAEE